MDNALVSIIITCYNQEQYILKVLESVKKQTYESWECIIIDDGSVDKSAKIIKNYICDDQRFKYFYQTNAGVSIARNVGFRQAIGDFIHFLDGDDTIFPTKLEKQIYCFEKDKNLSVCITDHQHFYVETNESKHYKFEILKSKPLEQLLYGWQNGVAFPLHAVLYKRNIWQADELPFSADYIGRSEDWIFNVMVALKGKSYLFLNEILCNYHMTGKSYTSNTENSAISAIHAAFYLHPYLPSQYQSDFLDFTIKKSMNRFLKSEKQAILKNSGNWRLGNTITKPFFNVINGIKKIF